MGDSEIEGRRPAAVYVSWVTFKNAIEQLVHGVPNQIDRTAFPGLSGAVQSQLLTGFKFLGLTKDDGKPTQALHALAVEDEGARKKKLESILRDRYADIFALDLEKVTPAQLNSQLEASYGITGDTREKASRFLLGALGYLDIKYSRWLSRETPSTGGSATPRRRRSTRSRANGGEEEEDTSMPQSPPSGTSKSVTLKSGGVLTVTASLDIFSLNADDRAFVFDLIDKLAKYEGKP